MSEDIIDWLSRRRDEAATSRDKAFSENDLVVANHHAEISEHLYLALTEIKHLRQQNADMTLVLKSRIILELRK